MIQQINNTNNGEVLRIKAVKGDSVEVLKYTNDSEIINYAIENIPIEGLQDSMYNALRLKLGEGFETSNSPINWIFEAELRLFRMKISDELYATETLEGSALGQLILQLITYFKPFVINSGGLSIVYMEEIFPEHYPIVNPYLANGSLILEKLENGEIIKIKELA